MEQSYLKSKLDYDKDTGLFTWKDATKYHSHHNGKIAGSKHHSGYIYINIDGKGYASHRLAWLYVYGILPDGKKQFIDHINGVRDDNRIENLRIVSVGENARNRKVQLNNNSGYPDVKKIVRDGKRKRTVRYSAQISYEGKRIWLGSFKTFEEAVSARKSAERLYNYIVREKSSSTNNMTKDDFDNLKKNKETK